MRVRNKEIRQRRHRKDKTIKAAIREAKAGGSEKKATATAKPKAAAATAVKKAPAKKAAPKAKKTEEA